MGVAPSISAAQWWHSFSISLILDLLCTHSHATAGGVGERLLEDTREENCILASVTVCNILYNSTLEWSDIHNIGPVVGVLRCYVALGLYITFLDTHHRSYILYIRFTSILYKHTIVTIHQHF